MSAKFCFVVEPQLKPITRWVFMGLSQTCGEEYLQCVLLLISTSASVSVTNNYGVFTLPDTERDKN